jgi:ATP-independent RNA helicase DbpA
VPNTFENIGLAAPLVAATQILGYRALTPIQDQAIPALLAGKDIVGQAATGSGKTAAFALPLIQKIQLRHRAPQALVLCPTRELSTQVAKEIRRLGNQLVGLQVLIVSGGQPAAPQIAALERGVHVVVGTPGRVLDLQSRGKLNLSSIKTLVLDEADRMLDMGFADEVTAILDEAPTKRQTALFSATMPAEILAISQRYQYSAQRITVAAEKTNAPAIKQYRFDTQFENKRAAIQTLLNELNRTRGIGSGIVFCNQKATVAEVAKDLSDAGLSCAGLSGDLEQFDRDRVLARFRNRSLQILVATDVVSRGIDVADLDLVVNYDLPVSTEVYVHRIGRTGRAGKQGIAVTITTPRDKRKVDDIEIFMQQTLQPFVIGEQKPNEKAGPDNVAPGLVAGSMATLCISGGRRAKLRPGDILGALTGATVGLAGNQIGKIEIHETYAYVAVPKQQANMVLQCLLNGQIKGRKFNVQLVH